MYSENDDFEEYNDDNQNDGNHGSFMDKAKEFYQNNKTLCLVCAGVLLLLLVLLMVNSCSSGNGNMVGKGDKIEIVVSEYETLSVGNTIKLNAEIKGVDSEPNYFWASSDESVVKVDQLGNVTALKLGSANVTINVDIEGEKYTASTSITVAMGNKDILPTDVSFPDGELLITVGDKYQLLKQVSPSDGYITDIVYTSGNTSIVDVSETGEIKAKKVGVTKIKMNVNNDKFTDEIVINVVDDNIDPMMIVNPETIMFENNSVTMIVGEDKSLAYQYLPTSAYVKDLKWSSSDEQIVTVSSLGVLTAMKEGSAVVTVKTRNNLTDTIAITVEKKVINVTSLSLVTSSNLSLKLYETSTIIVDVLPTDATDKSVTYTSSNPLVATVDNNGSIRAVGVGTSAITVKTNDRGFEKIVNVTVTNNSSSSSSSSSSNSSSSSSSCTYSDIFSNVSDDQGGLSTSSSGGETVTAKTVTIDTSNILTSCNSVKSIKYGYTTSGTSCASTNSVTKGDNIELTMPDGSGIMQICLKVILNNGDEYAKTYYIKYNTNESTENDESEDLTISLSYNYIGKQFALGRGNVFLGQITISSDTKFDSFKYCIGNGNGTTCVPNKNAAYQTPSQGYGSGNSYLAVEQNTTYTKNVNATTYATLFTASWENQKLCFIIRSSKTGNYSEVKCVTVSK